MHNVQFMKIFDATDNLMEYFAGFGLSYSSIGKDDTFWT